LCPIFKIGDKAFRVYVKRRKYLRQTKLDAIHDILASGKFYAQKAIELMLINPKISGDMEPQKYLLEA
jgi:hypothetical protein